MRTVLVFLSLWAGLFAWVPPAAGHAALVNSSPPSGAMLDQAPDHVLLQFNEPVSALVVRLLRPDGEVTELAGEPAPPNGLSLSLPSLHEKGAYALSWRVVSTDGHPVGGSVMFSLGAQDAAAHTIQEADWARDGAIWLVRWFSYGLWILGAGLAVAQVHSRCVRGRTRVGTARCVLWAGAVSVLLNAGLWGVDALDAPLAALFSIPVWRAAAASSLMPSWVSALLAVACAAWVWRVRSQAAAGVLAILCVVLLGASWAWTGHASAAPPTWLSMPSVWLHTMAVVLWIGVLWPLAVSLEGRVDVSLLQRFSRLIPWVLLVLLATGGVLAWLQLDGIASLWQTPYGRILLIKLCVVASLLGLGAYNRYRLTAGVLKGEPALKAALRRTIRSECALAIVVLGLVALWRFTPPPRAFALPPPLEAVSTHIHGETIMAQLTLVPALLDQAGSGAMSSGVRPPLQIELSGADGLPLQAQEVSIAFSNPQAGIEPLVFSAITQSQGRWQVPVLHLPHQARWQVRIDVLVSDFERRSLDAEVQMDDKP